MILSGLSQYVDLVRGRPSATCHVYIYIYTVIWMGMCACVCVWSLLFPSLRAKQAECWKHLFHLYVFCLQWHLRRLSVCLCVCRSECQKPHLTVYIYGCCHPCQCSPHWEPSHLILFTAHSLSTASNHDSTAGRTLQHEANISETYRVLDCPCNLHFMSTQSINTIDFHTVLFPRI